MSEAFYTQGLIDAVVKTALAAAKASRDGKSSIVLGDGKAAQGFALKAGGYCARFVRQVYETACGLAPFSWAYAAQTARQMTVSLEAAGHRVNDQSLVPGDIIGIHRDSGKYGHIAIYVGKVNGVATIAENTSSRNRGNPLTAGTKLTPYADVADRVTGVYRLLADVPAPKWPGFRSFLQVGRAWKEIVPVSNGDHRADQGKVYWRVKES